MNDGSAAIFLGIIAAATALMALLQIGGVIYAVRIAKRVEQLTEQFEQDIRPLVAKASAIADDASRVASMAVTQAERLEALSGNLARRIDETAAVIQNAIVTPAREGMAIVAGLRAGLAALRNLRHQSGHGRRVEDEDALFIG